MPRFKKEVLKPGEYHVRTADGKDWAEAKYTRADIERIASNAKATLAKGLTLPICDEHNAEAKPYRPGTKPAFTQLGEIKGVEVGADHTLTVELEADEASAQRLHALKFVSPELIPNYENSLTGERYMGPVLTHLAATYNPVAQPQKGYETVQLSAVRLSLGEWLGYGDEKPDNPDKGEKGETDKGEKGDLTEEKPPTDGPAPSTYTADDAMKCAEALGVHLAPGTNEANFFQHFCVAAHALIKAGKGGLSGDDEKAGLGQPGAPGQQPSQPKEVNAPVMMGLRREIDGLRKELAAHDQKSLNARLDALAKTLPAATMQRLRQQAKATQLSRGADGKLEITPLLAKLEAYEELGGIPLTGPALLSRAREVETRVNEGQRNGRHENGRQTEAETKAVIDGWDAALGRN